MTILSAYEQRGIHSAHEAGMHDEKPKPDKCKICARLQKEQEATQVAKEKTVCFCGGSYDGTPSGQAKHDATAKHQIAAKAHGETPQETLARLEAEAAEINARPSNADIAAALQILIDRADQELAARQIDHKWREKNRPAEAEAYFEAKVVPLRLETKILRDARAALGGK